VERRNWSLKALKSLQYIDSLNPEQRANSLQKWVKDYLVDNHIESFDLELKDLESLSELFYKNISFLKQHREDMKTQIDDREKIREFLV
jgi:predicted glycosyltransferase